MSGSRQHTSRMENTQANIVSSDTQDSWESIQITINRSIAAPPPVIKHERRSQSLADEAQRIIRNATRTILHYLGSPGGEGAKALMSWTECFNNRCQNNLSKKDGSDWYLQFTRRSRKRTVTHAQDCRPEMEVTQENGGPDNNLNSEFREGPIAILRVGSIVSTSNTRTICSKRWTMATTHDQ